MWKPVQQIRQVGMATIKSVEGRISDCLRRARKNEVNPPKKTGENHSTNFPFTSVPFVFSEEDQPKRLHDFRASMAAAWTHRATFTSH